MRLPIPSPIPFLLAIMAACTAFVAGCGVSDMATSPRSDPSSSEDPSGSGGEPKAGQVTAGEWNDLEHWDFWSGLMTGEWKSMTERWEFSPTSMVPVIVRNGSLPVMNARVILMNKAGAPIWETRTDNRGRAWLLPSVFQTWEAPYSIIAESGGVLANANVPEKLEGPVEMNLASRTNASSVDIMFMIDATGSMGDEMEYIKAELKDVINRVRNLNSEDLSIHLSCNVYRDHGDDYLVRSFPFTSNIDQAVQQLSVQRSGGGGDYPEAVDEALEDAVEKHQWRDDARTRLLFLVLDAPPHEEQPNISKLQSATASAARKGIKIIPVASSGIDKPTEFLLRFLSITTGGTYVFITDHSGIGNDHIEPTVGEYQVEYLNDLLVRVINKYVVGG